MENTEENQNRISGIFVPVFVGCFSPEGRGVSNRLAWKFKSRQIISEMSAHIRFCPLNLLPLFQNGLPHLLPLFSIQIMPICAILHLNNQICITYETHINTVFFDAFTPTCTAYSGIHNNSPS